MWLRLVVSMISAKNLGLKKDDIILEWNGDIVTLESFNSTIEKYYEETQPGDKVLVVVRRDEKGKIKEKKLKAKAMQVKSSQKHQMKIMDQLSDEQQKIKTIWLQPSNIN